VIFFSGKNCILVATKKELGSIIIAYTVHYSTAKLPLISKNDILFFSHQIQICFSAQQHTDGRDNKITGVGFRSASAGRQQRTAYVRLLACKHAAVPDPRTPDHAACVHA
jgi:hypothetical protein